MWYVPVSSQLTNDSKNNNIRTIAEIQSKLFGSTLSNKGENCLRIFTPEHKNLEDTSIRNKYLLFNCMFSSLLESQGCIHCFMAQFYFSSLDCKILITSDHVDIHNKKSTSGEMLFIIHAYVHADVTTEDNFISPCINHWNYSTNPLEK